MNPRTCNITRRQTRCFRISPRPTSSSTNRNLRVTDVWDYTWSRRFSARRTERLTNTLFPSSSPRPAFTRALVLAFGPHKFQEPRPDQRPEYFSHNRALGESNPNLFRQTRGGIRLLNEPGESVGRQTWSELHLIEAAG